MLRALCISMAVLVCAPALAQNASGKPQSADQLSQLLLSSPWCSFWYNQTSGASGTERVVFRPDGIVTSGSNAESYSSGRGGTVAGQTRGGKQGRWRVQGGALHLSEDGTNWEPQQLRITKNSNGYPIIKSGKKEYVQCK